MDRGGRSEKRRLVFCDVLAYVSCREYVGIPVRAEAVDVSESRWHRGKKFSVLDKCYLSWAVFVFIRLIQRRSRRKERNGCKCII